MKSKAIFGLLGLVVIALGFAGSGTVSATEFEINGKIRICHANVSSPNSESPYTINEVSTNATGNGNNSINGHLTHEGKDGDTLSADNFVIYSSEVHAQAKADKMHWGDIIPPTDAHPEGLNWTSEGIKVWESACGYYAEPEAGVATASIATIPATCESGEILVYGAITNAVFSGTEDGAEGPAQYSVIAEASEGSFFAENKSLLSFENSLAGPLTGEQCEEEVAEGEITAALACATVRERMVVSLTLSNSGESDIDALINDKNVSVPAGADSVVEHYESGEKVTVIVNDKTIIDRAMICEPGRGGEEDPKTPKTPETPEEVPVVLPYTSGVATPIVATGALSLLGLMFVASSAIKSRLLS